MKKSSLDNNIWIILKKIPSEDGNNWLSKRGLKVEPFPLLPHRIHRPMVFDLRFE